MQTEKLIKEVFSDYTEKTNLIDAKIYNLNLVKKQIYGLNFLFFVL